MPQNKIPLIIAIVITVHAGVLALCSIPSRPVVHQSKPLIVKTVQLNPGKLVAAASPMPVPDLLPEPEPESEPQIEPEPEPLVEKPKISPKPVAAKKPEPPPPAPKKKQPAPVAKKPTPPKPASPEKPRLTDKQKNLLEQAKEKVANLDLKNLKLKANKKNGNPAPKEIAALEIDGLTFDCLSASETSYADDLARRIKMLLCLPEYGAVKISITINRQGEVDKLTVIQSESKKNETYVLNQLKQAKLPPFAKHFNGENKHTFTMTLTND